VPQPTTLPRALWCHSLVCKNQRRIFGPKRGEIIGGLRKLRDERRNLPNISRMMRWAGNVTCMGEKRNSYAVSVGELDVGGKVVLKWILDKWDCVI
jgi:hypothetical protein